MIKEKLKFTKLIRKYTVTSALSVLLFLPWLSIFLLRFKFASESNFRNEPVSFYQYLLGLVRSISLFWGDFGLNEDSRLVYLFPFGIFLILLLCLITYSIYYLIRNRTKNNWLFILSLIIIPFLFLMIPDLASGGQRALVTRYLIPSFIGIQLAVYFLLDDKVFGDQYKPYWKGITGVILSISVFSSVIYTVSEKWWTKAEANTHYSVSQIINQPQESLLVSDLWVVHLISLSYYLDPSVKFQLYDKITSVDIPIEDFQSVFLYKPSSQLKLKLDQQYNLSRTEHEFLWKLANQTEGN